MLRTILGLLGFGNGASMGNAILGAVNYTTLASLATWAWLHRDEQITFTLSLGSLGIIIGVAWLVLELNRRSVYRADSPDDHHY